MRSTNRNDVELAVRRLDQVALAADIPYPHWLGGTGADQGPSYCHDCASKRVEAGEGEFVDGGWPQDNDGSCQCEDCGRTLDYTLTEYGVEEEMEHFTRRRLRGAINPLLAYALARVLEQHRRQPEVLRLLPKVCRALDRSLTATA